MKDYEQEMQYPPQEFSSEITIFCNNRLCHNEVKERGHTCEACSNKEIETCAKCGTPDDVWAFGHCSKCWVARNTQISDGYFCGFAECKDCAVYPYSCRTCQCDSCGDLYSLKENDSDHGLCYNCKEALVPVKCACGEETISENMDVCIDCYYSDPRIRHDINDE